MDEPCRYEERARASQKALEVIVGAFVQACVEAGLAPHHPGGECPDADCRCEQLADSIEARAIVLVAGRLGVPVADPEASDG